MARAPDLAVGQCVSAPHWGIFDGEIIDIEIFEVELIDKKTNRVCYVDVDAFDSKWNEANQQWELEA